MAISPQQRIRSTYIARDARDHLCDSTSFLSSGVLMRPGNSEVEVEAEASCYEAEAERKL